MQNTETYKLPYLESSDLVEDIASQSLRFVQGVEDVMTSGVFQGPPGVGVQGEPGPQGLPGLNAVPADDAVAAYVAAPDTSTRTALDTAYGDAATASLVRDTESLTAQAIREAAGAGASSDTAVSGLIGAPDSETRAAVLQAINAQAPALTAASKEYADTLVGNQVDVMATKGSLVATATLPGAVVANAYSLRPSANSTHTVFTAPFPLKIVSVTLVQSVATIPMDATNYMAVTWRKVAADGTTTTTVANKRTNVTDWGAHKPFSFENETQNEAAKIMAPGESLNFAFSVAGSGYYLFPINITVRYQPL